MKQLIKLAVGSAILLLVMTNLSFTNKPKQYKVITTHAIKTADLQSALNTYSNMGYTIESTTGSGNQSYANITVIMSK